MLNLVLLSSYNAFHVNTTKKSSTEKLKRPTQRTFLNLILAINTEEIITYDLCAVIFLICRGYHWSCHE